MTCCVALDNMYNDFCLSKNCKWVIEWEYQWDEEIQPYPCVSCKLVGQSHDILEYPDNCPYKDVIKNYKQTT